MLRDGILSFADAHALQPLGFLLRLAFSLVIGALFSSLLRSTRRWASLLLLLLLVLGKYTLSHLLIKVSANTIFRVIFCGSEIAASLHPVSATPHKI